MKSRTRDNVFINKDNTLRSNKIVIAMEGEKTEANYFKYFDSTQYNLDFVFLSDNINGVSPKKLKERIDKHYKDLKTKNRKISKKDIDLLDSVWIVCDMDKYLKELHQIQQELKIKITNWQ